MPSYKGAFGNFIKAEDLQGKALRVSIERVDVETIKGDGKEERKLVAHFAGKDKALVLNRTNADALASIFGTDDYDEWVGLVILFPSTTSFGGKTVPCIRIKASAAPAAPPPPVEPDPATITDDDIPF